MGFFNDSICTCCVCPMQCVLKQLIGQVVDIANDDERFNIQIEEVENFIVSGINSDGRRIHNPICQINSVQLSGIVPLNLKPIRKSTKGECVCCEDPITDVANLLKGQEVTIETSNLTFDGVISDVGEGIVNMLGVDPDSGATNTVVISSCFIEAILEGAPSPSS
ncbi:hypothetical protein [Chengkuizengella sediminis]|uniref:hypothetical protein n=1 Tax=Chengkuizengella sediminis TaxID=1885917 RepID=UPI001389DB2A|nr:hypothetical protein [Chengkuizengella sediminis]NDI34685.1 hypothetical protein [Chengkuizengella sediminis]